MKKYFLRLLEITNREEMRILPGNISFFMILSLMPLITVLTYICSLFSISLTNIINEITTAVPPVIADIIIPALSKPTLTISFSMLIGFFIASNGAKSIIIASDTLFKINESNTIKVRIKSIFMLIILLILFLFIMIVLAFGNIIMQYILTFEIIKNISEYIYIIFFLLKWPFAFILIYIMVKMIYTIAPSQHIPSKNMTVGSYFTTSGWMLITFIYSYYVSHFANYNLFYGSLANIVALMMWIYFLAFILVIGIAINSDQYNMENNTTDKKK